MNSTDRGVLRPMPPTWWQLVRWTSALAVASTHPGEGDVDSDSVEAAAGLTAGAAVAPVLPKRA